MEKLIDRLKASIASERAKDISILDSSQKREAEYNIQCLEKFLQIQEKMEEKKDKA